MRVRICGNLPPVRGPSLFILKALSFGARFALFIALALSLSACLLGFALGVALVGLRGVLIQRFHAVGYSHCPQSSARFLVYASLAVGDLAASGGGH